MKKTPRKLITLMLVSILAVASVLTANGITLYTDGEFTYADTGSDSVALYAWESESDTLVVANNFQSKYVTSVYNYAFMDNTQIAALDFSRNYALQSVGTKAFAGCSALTGDVVLPVTIQSLKLGAFQDCPKLNSMTLNGYVTVIPEQFCYNDFLLRDVNLPLNLERIENLAFANCYSLRNVYISETVNYIHPNAFNNCGNLVIECRYDTYAFHYAKDNGISFKLLDAVPLGDANLDGYVNINDVTAVQRHIAELELLNELEQIAADVNRDGDISIDDATKLQEYLAEYTVDYPIGEMVTHTNIY